MAGHSKWSKIKRKKGVADQKRGKIFTRCIHEIAVAAREGGGDPDGNPRLRLAIDQAKAVNMPNDNIDRAIKRATGELKGDEAQELTYEGYGPGGTAVLVEVLTDNKNRTVGEIRHAFTKAGGTLGENGCVAWMFDKKGLFAVKKEAIAEEALMEAALEAGAEDIVDEGDVWELTCPTKEFHTLKVALQGLVSLEMAEIQYLPKTRNPVHGETAEKIIRLLEALEDLDDVLSVSANCEFEESEGK
ncbi:MAG: YebC/PmpR family DNA-binding transcriptional regulator [Bdellovibrionales bacterium]|nr:YebC/PmpR family DNA-binding transcriptional regulator [Bdellovibrionales bacterium]